MVAKCEHQNLFYIFLSAKFVITAKKKNQKLTLLCDTSTVLQFVIVVSNFTYCKNNTYFYSDMLFFAASIGLPKILAIYWITTYLLRNSWCGNFNMFSNKGCQMPLMDNLIAYLLASSTQYTLTEIHIYSGTYFAVFWIMWVSFCGGRSSLCFWHCSSFRVPPMCSPMI